MGRLILFIGLIVPLEIWANSGGEDELKFLTIDSWSKNLWMGELPDEGLHCGASVKKLEGNVPKALESCIEKAELACQETGGAFSFGETKVFGDKQFSLLVRLECEPSA